MRVNTQSITVAAPPEKVLQFVADPANLPEWAVGFAQEIRHEDGQWIVTSPQGDVGLRVDVDRARGIVDYAMSPGPGVEVTAFSRVLPNEHGSEYVFTQFQPPATTDEDFDGQIEALGQELQVLQGLLEPR